jgi:hypothetical protein
MPHNQIAILAGHDPEELGMLPDFIDQNDPRPAAEQFEANYQHGGGWRPIKGFIHRGGVSLHYLGDPPYHPIATWPLRHEMIVVYRYGLVAIFNTKTGDFEVARLD